MDRLSSKSSKEPAPACDAPEPDLARVCNTKFNVPRSGCGPRRLSWRKNALQCSCS